MKEKCMIHQEYSAWETTQDSLPLLDSTSFLSSLLLILTMILPVKYNAHHLEAKVKVMPLATFILSLGSFLGLRNWVKRPSRSFQDRKKKKKRTLPWLLSSCFMCRFIFTSSSTSSSSPPLSLKFVTQTPRQSNGSEAVLKELRT